MKIAPDDRDYHILLIILLASFCAYAAALSPSGHELGDYVPIKNLSDPYVQGIAKFAVAEYNNQTASKLKLAKIIRGWTQVVEGVNYCLDLSTYKDNKTLNYEAIVWVWDVPQEHFNLTSFTPLCW